MPGQRWRWAGAPLTVAWILALVPGCTRKPATPVIGFALGAPAPHAGTVAQAAIDRARPPDAMRIVVGLPLDTSGIRAGLFGEVERAIAFAADPGLVVVVGPGGSREALQTTPIYRDAGVPNIVPTATSSRLHHVGEWTFMLASDDSVQGEFLGAFAAQTLRARTVLLFYVPDEYGLGLAAGTAASLMRYGVRLLDRVPVGATGSCPPYAGANDYQEAVDAGLALGRPDVVVLAVRDLSAACLAQATQARRPGTRFLAGDGVLVDTTFLRVGGPAIDSFYLAAFWHPARPDPTSRAFVAEFERIVGRRPRHDDAMFYDATMLGAAAIRVAGADRRAVRSYLNELGRSRPPYVGITGPIAFTPEAQRPLLMVRIRRGVTEPVP